MLAPRREPHGFPVILDSAIGTKPRRRTRSLSSASSSGELAANSIFEIQDFSSPERIARTRRTTKRLADASLGALRTGKGSNPACSCAESGTTSPRRVPAGYAFAQTGGQLILQPIGP